MNINTVLEHAVGGTIELLRPEAPFWITVCSMDNTIELRKSQVIFLLEELEQATLEYADHEEEDGFTITDSSGRPVWNSGALDLDGLLALHRDLMSADGVFNPALAKRMADFCLDSLKQLELDLFLLSGEHRNEVRKRGEHYQTLIDRLGVQ